MSPVETSNWAVSSHSFYIWCGARICQKREDDGETIVRNYFRHGFTEGEDTFVCVRAHLGSVWQVVEGDGETVTSLSIYGLWGLDICTHASKRTPE